MKQKLETNISISMLAMSASHRLPDMVIKKSCRRDAATYLLNLQRIVYPAADVEFCRMWSGRLN